MLVQLTVLDEMGEDFGLLEQVVESLDLIFVLKAMNVGESMNRRFTYQPTLKDGIDHRIRLFHELLLLRCVLLIRTFALLVLFGQFIDTTELLLKVPHRHNARRK